MWPEYCIYIDWSIWVIKDFITNETAHSLDSSHRLSGALIMRDLTLIDGNENYPYCLLGTSLKMLLLW